jgi:hypothetical protein
MGLMKDLENEDIEPCNHLTIEERFAAVWQLTQDAMALRGESINESILPRNVGSTERRAS